MWDNLLNFNCWDMQQRWCVYLNDTRYAGESCKLIGSSFTGRWCHQTKEGRLQRHGRGSTSALSTFRFYFWLSQKLKANRFSVISSLTLRNPANMACTDHQQTCHLPYPQKETRWEQHGHLLISSHRSPRLWPLLTWRAPGAAPCIWLAWP